MDRARRLAEREGVEVTFLVDDILATRLEGPFDLILDRGVFHVFAPEAHGRYLAAVSWLLRPGGLLLLKCFSAEETRPECPPGRYAPEDIRRIFSGPFRVVEIRPSAFARPGDDDPPKALFCVNFR
ncbi:hypothetical protein MIN45_P1619 [Methylomarinovum tepidoasis]|uniref:Class I SAM-dependent methyltransferase n=1 Tax=Methylomarinovum tepidoasis TaxID=2840183 RepID=A0AAU9C6Q5_9GAMM|nr:hypothetical protein MIN45_P1619 [Methylomarinovum sp. IN45]